MKTAFEIAGPVVVCGWFVIGFIRKFCASNTAEEDQ